MDHDLIFSGEMIRTRACGGLDEAYMYSTTPLMFDETSVEGYAALMKQVRVSRNPQPHTLASYVS